MTLVGNADPRISTNWSGPGTLYHGKKHVLLFKERIIHDSGNNVSMRYTKHTITVHVYVQGQATTA